MFPDHKLICSQINFFLSYRAKPTHMETHTHAYTHTHMGAHKESDEYSIVAFCKKRNYKKNPIWTSNHNQNKNRIRGTIIF